MIDINLAKRVQRLRERADRRDSKRVAFTQKNMYDLAACGLQSLPDRFRKTRFPVTINREEFRAWLDKAEQKITNEVARTLVNTR